MEKFFDKRKEYVANFIKSFLTQKQLSQVSGFDETEDMCTDNAVSLSPTHPFDENLNVGQIRLLSQTERITYVVLLRRWEENSFVVLPFSAYNSPATEEEFLPEYDGGIFQRVLQIWNIRTLQDTTLKKSWLVDYLPQNDIDDAWRLWEASLGGMVVEDRLVEKTALPIYHSNDPRLEYKQMELKNFAKLDAEDLALIDMPQMLWLGNYYINESMPMAAGSEAENLQFNYFVKNKDIICFVEYSRFDKQLSFYVNTPDGAKSHELDGCMICEYPTNKCLGFIADGVLKADYELTRDSKIQILNANGKEIEGFFEEILDD